jgi:hypothetical protein
MASALGGGTGSASATGANIAAETAAVISSFDFSTDRVVIFLQNLVLAVFVVVGFWLCAMVLSYALTKLFPLVFYVRHAKKAAIITDFACIGDRPAGTADGEQQQLQLQQQQQTVSPDALEQGKAPVIKSARIAAKHLADDITVPVSSSASPQAAASHAGWIRRVGRAAASVVELPLYSEKVGQLSWPDRFINDSYLADDSTGNALEDDDDEDDDLHDDLQAYERQVKRRSAVRGSLRRRLLTVDVDTVRTLRMLMLVCSIVVGAYFAVKVMDFDLVTVLAAAGVVTYIGVFRSKGISFIIDNLLAGITIRMLQEYVRGDAVYVQGYNITGTIKRVGVLYTVMSDLSEQLRTIKAEVVTSAASPAVPTSTAAAYMHGRMQLAGVIAVEKPKLFDGTEGAGGGTSVFAIREEQVHHRGFTAAGNSGIFAQHKTGNGSTHSSREEPFALIMNPDRRDLDQDGIEDQLERASETRAPAVYRRRDPSAFQITYVYKVPNSVFLNNIVSYIVVKRKRKSDVNIYA